MTMDSSFMGVSSGAALGATAAELIANPQILAQAKEEHLAQVGKTGYICPIPKDIIPKPRTARRAP